MILSLYLNAALFRDNVSITCSTRLQNESVLLNIIFCIDLDNDDCNR